MGKNLSFRVDDLKIRNRVALNAWNKTGAGPHKDAKHYAKTHACDTSEWEDELEDYWASLDSEDDV